MLSQNHLAPIGAALRYWADEMTPQTTQIQQPYFATQEQPSLTTQEVQTLIALLEVTRLYYVAYETASNQLVDLELQSDVNAVHRSSHQQVAVVLLP